MEPIERLLDQIREMSAKETEQTIKAFQKVIEEGTKMAAGHLIMDVADELVATIKELMPLATTSGEALARAKELTLVTKRLTRLVKEIRAMDVEAIICQKKER